MSALSRHGHVVRWAHKYVCLKCGKKPDLNLWSVGWNRTIDGWFHNHSGEWIKAIKSEPSEKRAEKQFNR